MPSHFIHAPGRARHPGIGTTGALLMLGGLALLGSACGPPGRDGGGEPLTPEVADASAPAPSPRGRADAAPVRNDGAAAGQDAAGAGEAIRDAAAADTAVTVDAARDP